MARASARLSWSKSESVRLQLTKPLCGRDVTRARNCRIRGQSAPLSDSYARVCDTHTTFHMIPAHGTYVAPHLLRERERAYLQANNKKKRETSVESSNPVKGDDP
jgi:hypothetical protein